MWYLSTYPFIATSMGSLGLVLNCLLLLVISISSRRQSCDMNIFVVLKCVADAAMSISSLMAAFVSFALLELSKDGGSGFGNDATSIHRSCEILALPTGLLLRGHDRRSELQSSVNSAVCHCLSLPARRQVQIAFCKIFLEEEL